MNKLNKVILITIFIATSFSCFSQSTYSPYTYYGIGEFENSDHSRMSGMGGVGIGVSTKGFLNYSNPASYSNIDSLNFILDIAFSGTYSKFESGSSSYHALYGNLKKLSLGFRFLPYWSFSAGVVPFTNVGYKTTIDKDIEGMTDQFSITCEGKGGLSKLFIGNAFKIGNRLSIGVNSNILLGYFEKDETYSSSISSDEWENKLEYKPKTTFSFDFGAQFSDSIGSKYKYTVGLVGGLKSKLQFLKYETRGSTSSTVEEEEYVNDFDFWIPTYGGIGFSLNSKKWMFAGDYKFQYWENVKSKNDIPWLTNSHHVAMGAQYCPRAYIGKNILERMTYQVGAHFDRSYLKIKSNNFDTYGVTLGVLAPIRGQTIGFSIDAGKKGRIAKGMFKENYIQLNLSVNFSDIWFQKRRFN